MPDSQPTAIVEYRPIENFPGYRVGNNGTVQSCRTRGGKVVPWREMSLQLDGSGRYFVGLRRDGKIHRSPISRLVLEAFVGHCPEGMEGCHDNGDPLNNNSWNLRWDTHAANMVDRENHGRTPRGSRNAEARLDETQVIEIRRRYEAGEGDQYQLAEQFGVGQSTIGRIVRREQWRHV